MIFTAVAILQQKRIPSAPILTIPEVMELGHSRERGIVRTLTDPVFGSVKTPRSPMRFSQFPDSPALEAGMLGQTMMMF